jgi:methylmalonyl-CoA mutase N-terminal domain/subunit
MKKVKQYKSNYIPLKHVIVKLKDSYRVIIASQIKIVLQNTKLSDLYAGVSENVQENFFYRRFISFKREGEDPSRMFAGEGGPERTNKRFH